MRILIELLALIVIVAIIVGCSSLFVAFLCRLGIIGMC